MAARKLDSKAQGQNLVSAPQNKPSASSLTPTVPGSGPHPASSLSDTLHRSLGVTTGTWEMVHGGERGRKSRNSG